MKRNLVLLFIIFLQINVFSQNVSDYIICSKRIGSLELHKKIDIINIIMIGKSTRIIHTREMDSFRYKKKFYNFGDTLVISLYKSKYLKLRYTLGAISFKYPSQITTNEGIQIRVSTYNDVIDIYGKPLEESDHQLLYALQNDVIILFQIYEYDEITDTEYYPELENKVVGIYLY